MIFFDAVVKNGDNDPSSCVSIVPRWYNIHVEATGSVLQSHKTLYSSVFWCCWFSCQKLYNIPLQQSPIQSRTQYNV